MSTILESKLLDTINSLVSEEEPQTLESSTDIHNINFDEFYIDRASSVEMHGYVHFGKDIDCAQYCLTSEEISKKWEKQLHRDYNIK